MILWTIQTEGAIRRMERTGALRGDGRRPWREHRHSFRWMIRQMRQRIGPPPPGSAYPVWAWKVYSARSPRPDLRRVAQLPRGTRGARIEFETPEDRVLLSDFDRWDCVQCDEFLYDDLQEYEEMEKQKVWRDPDRVEQSWSRIFELERGDPAQWGDPCERSIQVTLWSVELSQVRAMTWFTAR